MMKFFRDNRGATLVEFSLVAMPVLMFIFGIMLTAWIVWVSNMLQVSVNTAARCGAVGSTTSPCQGPTVANMISTANLVFLPLSGAGFVDGNLVPAIKPACTPGQTMGLVGTYTINLFIIAPLTLTATSCYSVLVLS